MTKTDRARARRTWTFHVRLAVARHATEGGGFEIDMRFDPTGANEFEELTPRTSRNAWHYPGRRGLQRAGDPVRDFQRMPHYRPV